MPLAALVDIARRSRGVALRSAVLIAVYLSCEIIGMLASAGLWVWRCLLHLDADRWTDFHFGLQAWWGTTLFGTVVRLFGLRLEIEGDPDLERGPYLLLLRHASTFDTLLASALLHQRIRVQFRRIAREEIPNGREAQFAWLLEQWQRVDAWIARSTMGPGGSHPPDAIR